MDKIRFSQCPYGNDDCPKCIVNKRKYFLPKFICQIFYHRFGYQTNRCVRCGISIKEADGFVISSKYDSN